MKIRLKNDDDFELIATGLAQMETMYEPAYQLNITELILNVVKEYAEEVEKEFVKTLTEEQI